MKRFGSALAAVLALGFSASAAFAGPHRRIERRRVRRNVRITRAAVRTHGKIGPGRPYAHGVVRGTARKLRRVSNTVARRQHRRVNRVVKRKVKKAIKARLKP